MRIEWSERARQDSKSCFMIGWFVLIVFIRCAKSHNNKTHKYIYSKIYMHRVKRCLAVPNLYRSVVSQEGARCIAPLVRLLVQRLLEASRVWLYLLESCLALITTSLFMHEINYWYCQNTLPSLPILAGSDVEHKISNLNANLLQSSGDMPHCNFHTNFYIAYYYTTFQKINNFRFKPYQL